MTVAGLNNKIKSKLTFKSVTWIEDNHSLKFGNSTKWWQRLDGRDFYSKEGLFNVFKRLCTKRVVKSVVEVVDVCCDGLRLCRLVSTDWPCQAFLEINSIRPTWQKNEKTFERSCRQTLQGKSTKSKAKKY